MRRLRFALLCFVRGWQQFPALEVARKQHDKLLGVLLTGLNRVRCGCPDCLADRALSVPPEARPN